MRTKIILDKNGVTQKAKRKLRILIKTNYGYGDYRLVLDYTKERIRVGGV